MRVPDYPQPGPPRLEWGRSVVDAIRALWPVESPTAKPVMVGSGTCWHVKGGSRPTPTEIFYGPFQLIASATDGENPEPRVRVKASTLGGEFPTDGGEQTMTALDTEPFLLVPIQGEEVYVYAYVEIDRSAGGSIIKREIRQSAVWPTDTASSAALVFGGYRFTIPEGEETPVLTAINNVGYGPISVLVCRDWYSSSDPPDYSILLHPSGAFPQATT